MSTPTFAVTRIPGPAWVQAHSMRAQTGWDDHAAFMNGLVDEGFILLGGPLADSEELEVMLIISADSEEQVRARLGEDPWERAGLLQTIRIRPWTILLNTPTD